MLRKFRERSLQTELLDEPGIPFEHIRRNMMELAVINRRLGGHRITIKGMRLLLEQREKRADKAATLHIVEMGCGGGDNLKALAVYCRRQGIAAQFTGIDYNPACITYARDNCNGFTNIDFVQNDYRQATFNHKPDILFSSLFCHHFSNEQLAGMLQWMARNSALGFFINDLHRHPLAYYGIQQLTRFFSKSYLVKHDAPLSVLRGFRQSDWQVIFKCANISNYSISREWAFRHLIISLKNGHYA